MSAHGLSNDREGGVGGPKRTIWSRLIEKHHIEHQESEMVLFLEWCWRSIKRERRERREKGEKEERKERKERKIYGSRKWCFFVDAFGA